MMTNTRSIRASRTATGAALMLLLLIGCGGGAESDKAANAPDAGNGSAPAAASGGSGAGPDTSKLADFILAKINADPTRQEMKVTGKMLEFNIVSSATESHGNMGASSVVECAGVAVFDGDVAWSWQDTTPKKAGEPAKFECRVEYANQGQGWEIFGPVGIYPL